MAYKNDGSKKSLRDMKMPKGASEEDELMLEDEELELEEDLPEMEDVLPEDEEDSELDMYSDDEIMEEMKKRGLSEGKAEDELMVEDDEEVDEDELVDESEMVAGSF